VANNADSTVSVISDTPLSSTSSTVPEFPTAYLAGVALVVVAAVGLASRIFDPKRPSGIS